MVRTLRAPRRRLPLVALTLAAVLLRAFIPTGFMPQAGADGMSLAFCPGAGAVPQPATAHMGHASHVHGAASASVGGSSGHPHTTAYPDCLFSVGAAAGFTHLAAAVAPALGSVGASARRVTLVFVAAILRAQSPRAPPVP